MSEDTANPFVRSQTNPERFNEISQQIEQQTGENTRTEMDKRLGNVTPGVFCPQCGTKVVLK